MINLTSGRLSNLSQILTGIRGYEGESYHFPGFSGLELSFECWDVGDGCEGGVWGGHWRQRGQHGHEEGGGRPTALRAFPVSYHLGSQRAIDNTETNVCGCLPTDTYLWTLKI